MFGNRALRAKVRALSVVLLMLLVAAAGGTVINAAWDGGGQLMVVSLPAGELPESTVSVPAFFDSLSSGEQSTHAIALPRDRAKKVTRAASLMKKLASENQHQLDNPRASEFAERQVIEEFPRLHFLLNWRPASSDQRALKHVLFWIATFVDIAVPQWTDAHDIPYRMRDIASELISSMDDLSRNEVRPMVEGVHGLLDGEFSLMMYDLTELLN